MQWRTVPLKNPLLSGKPVEAGEPKNSELADGLPAKLLTERGFF